MESNLNVEKYFHKVKSSNNESFLLYEEDINIKLRLTIKKNNPHYSPI